MPEIISDCKLKSKLLKTYRRFKNNVSHTKYKILAKRVKNNLKAAETKYYADKFYKCRDNSKEMWKEINLLMKPGMNANNDVQSFKINVIVTKDPDKIANGFNDYFVNVGPNLHSNIKVSSSADTINFPMGPSPSNSIHLKPCSPIEIEDIIRKLKNKSSTGPDNLSIKAIKAASPFISGILAHLINSTLVTGTFPHTLKLAKVIPIHKDVKRN